MARGEVRYRLTLDSNVKQKAEEAAAAMKTSGAEVSASLEKMGGSFEKGTDRAAKVAGSIDLVSKKMAGLGAAAGLPEKALRTISDVADLADVGFQNLGKGMAGFNAASVGVAGAGLAIGGAIGAWLNTFPAVRKGVDDLRDSIMSLAFGIELADRNAKAMAGMGDFQKKMNASNAEAVAKQIELLKKQGLSVEEIEKRYTTVQRPLKSTTDLVKEWADQQRKLTESTKQHAAEVNKVAEAEKKALLEFASKRGVAGFGMGSAFGFGAEAFHLADVFGVKGADPVKELGLGPNFGNLLKNQFGTYAASAGKEFKSDFSVAIQGLGGVILGAIQGGGNVGGAIGASLGGGLGADIGKMLAASIGGSLGKALGSLGGPLGSLLGGAAGGLFGKLFGGLFGGEGKKVNDMRDQFIAAAGGLDALNRKAHEAGMTLDALLRADKVNEFEAAVAGLTGAFDLQGQAQRELNAAAEKYGFTTQNQIDMMGGQLLKEWELLSGAQFNSNEILQKMAPNLNEYIQTALKAGTAIPENFRPILEQMVSLGLLTDESGKAFGTLEEAGITFTESLIDEIRKLVAALRGVPDSMPNLGGGGGGANVPGRGEHEFRNFQGGGYVTKPEEIVRMHGPEWAVPEGSLPGLAQGIAGALGGMMGGGQISGRLEVDLVRGVAYLVGQAVRNNEDGLRSEIRSQVLGEAQAKG